MIIIHACQMAVTSASSVVTLTAKHVPILYALIVCPATSWFWEIVSQSAAMVEWYSMKNVTIQI